MRGTTNIPSVYVILRKDGKIAFLRRAHTGYKDGTLALPSGHVEVGESFRQAAVRETLEEAGVTVRPDDLRQIYTLQRYEGPDNVRVDVFFEARDWKGEPHNTEPHKHSELTWLSPEDVAKENVMDFQAAVLSKLAEGETYHESGWEAVPV